MRRMRAFLLRLGGLFQKGRRDRDRVGSKNSCTDLVGQSDRLSLVLAAQHPIITHSPGR
jgi:hypothetical protein